jgi:hypothetical protein
MIRLGMLDFDTSHAIEDADQHVHSAQIVVACAGESKMCPERIPGYKNDIETLGIPLVENHTDMIGQVGTVFQLQEDQRQGTLQQDPTRQGTSGTCVAIGCVEFAAK